MAEETPHSSQPPPQQLAYEQPGGVTRSAFRLLLLLTFLNTILLGINLMGPQSWQAVRSAYTTFQDRRARAKAAELRALTLGGALRAAATFRFPDGHVAYTEGSEEAMKLVSQGLAFRPIPRTNGGDTPPPGWQAPVIASPPPALLAHPSLSASGSLFAHDRTSPNGTTLLVLAVVHATYQFESETNVLNNNTAEVKTYRLSKHRRLQAAAFSPSPAGELTRARLYELDLVLPDTQPVEFATVARDRRGAGPATTAVKPVNELRVFGGTPDPADPSHFTIPYELDGRPGTIDGWLKDDALVLQPREGRPLPSGDVPRWELPAAPRAATAPAEAKVKQ